MEDRAQFAVQDRVNLSGLSAVHHAQIRRKIRDVGDDK